MNSTPYAVLAIAVLAGLVSSCAPVPASSPKSDVILTVDLPPPVPPVFRSHGKFVEVEAVKLTDTENAEALPAGDDLSLRGNLFAIECSSGGMARLRSAKGEVLAQIDDVHSQFSFILQDAFENSFFLNGGRLPDKSVLMPTAVATIVRQLVEQLISQSTTQPSENVGREARIIYESLRTGNRVELRGHLEGEGSFAVIVRCRDG